MTTSPTTEPDGVTPRRLRVAAAALAIVASGCAARGPTVVVSVVTDLAPGVDFVGARVVLRSGAERIAERERIATEGSWANAHDVAIVDDVPFGPLDVDVTFIDPRGATLLSRHVRETLTEDRVIVVGLEAGCVGIACPEGEECRGGACRPTCVDCPPLCASDADCPASASCGEGTCSGGTCVYREGRERCTANEICHPTRGCVPTVVMTVQCRLDDDCPTPVVGSWTTCTWIGDPVCAIQGERTREVTSFTCAEERCVPSTVVEREDCARETDGLSCGDASCTDWSACRFPACQATGARWRDCSNPACRGGACDPGTVTSVVDCTRPAPEGEPCLAETGYGACAGTCEGTTCASLCASCGPGAYCSLLGCRRAGGESC